MVSAGASSHALNMALWTLAWIRLSVVAQSTPAWDAWTHGWQSTRMEHPGSAPVAAMVTAHASVPGISVTQSGGTPNADATVLPVLFLTVNAQPFLPRRWSLPSCLEPSVYIAPTYVPLGGRTSQ